MAIVDLLLVVLAIAVGDILRRLVRHIVFDSWFWQVDWFVVGAAGGASQSHSLAEAFARGISYGAFLAFAFTFLAWQAR